jgi:hypothetical protein
VQRSGLFLDSVALHESFWNSGCIAQVSQVEVFDYYYFMITVSINIQAILDSMGTG